MWEGHILLTMATLRGQLRALSNDRNLRRYVLQATPTGISLGTGSYGSVEEVRPCVCVCVCVCRENGSVSIANTIGP